MAHSIDALNRWQVHFYVYHGRVRPTGLLCTEFCLASSSVFGETQSGYGCESLLVLGGGETLLDAPGCTPSPHLHHPPSVHRRSAKSPTTRQKCKRCAVLSIVARSSAERPSLEAESNPVDAVLTNVVRSAQPPRPVSLLHSII